MAEDDGFLRRWSARKVDAKTKEAEPDPPDAQPTVAVVDPDTNPVPATGAESDAEEAEAVAVEDLPDIETLDKDSDFTVFLKEGVPEKLRNMALRKLWLSDPVLANVDGLVDYGEDFTDAALVIEGMQSTYQVGKGFITEEDEKKMAEQAAAEAAEAEAAAAEASDESAEDTPAAESESASGEEPAGDPDTAETADAESEDDPDIQESRES